jgi:predicted RNA-binding Zn-ribbon protein involved in translation (DUF1610 family)
MMDYKNYVRHMPVCLECGDRIRYGRTDKKFCCPECKTIYYNRQTKDGKAFRRKILRQLDRNYGILESLVRSGITSADMTDLIAMGFAPGFVTSCKRLRSRMEYTCFDIKYIMTPSRLSSISKIQNVSVPLQVGTEINNL